MVAMLCSVIFIYHLLFVSRLLFSFYLFFAIIPLSLSVEALSYASAHVSGSTQRFLACDVRARSYSLYRNTSQYFLSHRRRHIKMLLGVDMLVNFSTGGGVGVLPGRKIRRRIRLYRTVVTLDLGCRRSSNGV